MGTHRRSRTRRPPRRNYRLTARDIELLHALGRMKLATTGLLRLLFFTGRTAATRRLGKILSLGFVRIFTPDINAENLYALTRTGARLLVEQGVEERDLHVQEELVRADPHLLAINTIRAALVVAARGRPDVRIAAFRADHDLRRLAATAGRGMPVFIPDALVLLEVGSITMGLVLEFDTGSEHRAAFQSKVETTVRLWTEHRPVWGLPPPWRVALVTKNEQRLRGLAPMIVRLGGGGLWLGTTLDRVTKDPWGPAFAPIEVIAATAKDALLTFGGRLVPTQRGVR